MEDRAHTHDHPVLLHPTTPDVSLDRVPETAAGRAHLDPDPVRRVPNEDPGHNPDQDQLPRGHRVDHHPHHETLGLLSSVLPSLVDHHAVGGWGSDHCGLALAEVGDLSSYPLLAFLLVRARVQVRGAGGPSVCRVDPVHLVRAAGHTGARDGTLAMDETSKVVINVKRQNKRSVTLCEGYYEEANHDPGCVRQVSPYTARLR